MNEHETTSALTSSIDGDLRDLQAAIDDLQAARRLAAEVRANPAALREMHELLSTQFQRPQHPDGARLDESCERQNSTGKGATK